MLYNDSATGTGICQEIDSICGSNTTSYPLVDKNRRLNSAIDDFATIALKECGGWTPEDSGETNLPIATTDLDSGTGTYSFPSELLSIINLKIKASDGVTQITLTPVDTLPLNQSAGQPTAYKKVGNSFILDRTPNYSVTDGIEIEYRRAFNYSTVSGSTFTPTSPGIPSIFHTWLARKASLPYLITKGIASKNDIFTLITEELPNIKSYFGQKSRDVPRRLVSRASKGVDSNR